jgi:hypothetical protein
MIIETVRYVADVLDDVTIGVDAKIDAIGLDGADTRPVDLASVKNEFDHGIVARRHVPAAESTPMLMVFQPREVELDGWVTTEVMDVRDLPVAVVVVTQDADTEGANVASAYYVRAIMQSLNDRTITEGRRTRNNVQIMNHRNVVFINPYMPIGDAVMTRGVLLGFQSRDLTP